MVNSANYLNIIFGNDENNLSFYKIIEEKNCYTNNNN